MIVYSITMNIDKSLHEEWIDWMKLNYVDVLHASGLLTDSKVLKLLTEEEDNPGITYSFQFGLKSLDDLQRFLDEHEQHLISQVYQRYRGKFVEFRTILEVV